MQRINQLSQLQLDYHILAISFKSHFFHLRVTPFMVPQNGHTVPLLFLAQCGPLSSASQTFMCLRPNSNILLNKVFLQITLSSRINDNLSSTPDASSLGH